MSVKKRLVMMRNVEHGYDAIYEEKDANILSSKKGSKYLITSHPLAVEFELLQKSDKDNNELAMLRAAKEQIISESRCRVNQVEDKIQNIISKG